MRLERQDLLLLIIYVMLIGLLSLATTLAASVGLRAHELAALSALGFSRRMLRRAITCEGVLIACIGVVLGLACGMAIGRAAHFDPIDRRASPQVNLGRQCFDLRAGLTRLQIFHVRGERDRQGSVRIGSQREGGITVIGGPDLPLTEPIARAVADALSAKTDSAAT